jgi:hypothetical protein
MVIMFFMKSIALKLMNNVPLCVSVKIACEGEIISLPQCAFNGVT